MPHGVPPVGPRRPDGRALRPLRRLRRCLVLLRVPEAAAEAASAALDRPGVELAARAQWPTGADRLGVDVKGKIAAGDQLEPGRAVARLTDLGWGQRLRTLLGDDGIGGSGARPRGPRHRGGPRRRLRRPRASLGHRRAARRRTAPRVRPRAGAWDWAQRPGAVVAMPSRRRPQLVSGLAQGLARLGRLPYLGEMSCSTAARPGSPAGTAPSGWPPCGTGSSSGPAARAAAEAGAAPVLLVDDLADSRWTMTVAGRELRRAGAAGVLPFALALTA